MGEHFLGAFSQFLGATQHKSRGRICAAILQVLTVMSWVPCNFLSFRQFWPRWSVNCVSHLLVVNARLLVAVFLNFSWPVCEPGGKDLVEGQICYCDTSSNCVFSSKSDRLFLFKDPSLLVKSKYFGRLAVNLGLVRQNFTPADQLATWVSRNVFIVTLFTLSIYEYNSGI